jgi:hypothetical protein
MHMKIDLTMIFKNVFGERWTGLIRRILTLKY